MCQNVIYNKVWDMGHFKLKGKYLNDPFKRNMKAGAKFARVDECLTFIQLNMVLTWKLF